MVLFYVVLIVLLSIWIQLQVLITKYEHTRILHLLMQTSFTHHIPLDMVWAASVIQTYLLLT